MMQATVTLLKVLAWFTAATSTTSSSQVSISPTKTHFWHKNSVQSWLFGFEILEPKILYEKCVHKMLMKLRQVSISPTFFARVFHLKTHFWHKNSVQSWLFGLKFWHQKFCTKNACIKR